MLCIKPFSLISGFSEFELTHIKSLDRPDTHALCGAVRHPGDKFFLSKTYVYSLPLLNQCPYCVRGRL